MVFIKNKVSIIITCFNQQLFISECVQSVLSQTYINWECIIIDDGSSDNTKLICENFASMDNRIRYYYQDNQGVTISRNNGFKIANGEYVHFLDGDDYIASGKFAIQIEFMNDHQDIDICYTNHTHLFHEKKISVQYKFKPLNGCPIKELLYEYDYGVSIPIHSAMLRHTIWNKDEMPFEIDYQGRYEDWVFWVNIALKERIFYFINYDLAVYRIHQLNFCSTPIEVINHSTNAMLFISTKLFGSDKDNFLLNRQLLLMNRYQDYLFSAIQPKFIFKNIVDNLILFLNRFKNRSLKTKLDIINFISFKKYLFQIFISRKRLSNKNFSIISNNCWGGRVYKELKVPYFTPTIGLYFFSSCYIKFVQNLEYYLNQPLNFILTSKYEKANNLRVNNPYPIGILNNDVEVHFLHYYTKSDALEKWNRRKDRINYNNLFFSFTDNESCSFDEIQAFDNLDFNKVFFSSKNFESIQSLIWLKQFTASDGIGDIYSNPREYRKYFDAVDWLNSTTNQ